MDKHFHIENRRRLPKHMTDSDAMLLFSNESVRKSADEQFRFLQTATSCI